MNTRCPATGMNESAEEDGSYSSSARKPSASKSNFGRRRAIEVCPTRMLDHPRSFSRVVSRGDPEEVLNLDLAALESQSEVEIAHRLSSSSRHLFSLRLTYLSRSQRSRIHQGQRARSGGSHWM